MEVAILPGEALMESTPAPVDALDVEQMGGGTTKVSPTEAAMAWTSEPELLASSAIEGSTPEGAPVTEGVPSAPVRPTPVVAKANLSS